MTSKDESIDFKDYSKCPLCGAKLAHQGYSLHVWDKTYECGLHVWGALGYDEVSVDEDCGNVNK